MTASPILAEFDVTELTETQQRAIRRGSRGRVEARSSTLRVLRERGLVVVHLGYAGTYGMLTDRGRAARLVLLRAAAPEVHAVD